MIIGTEVKKGSKNGRGYFRCSLLFVQLGHLRQTEAVYLPVKEPQLECNGYQLENKALVLISFKKPWSTK